MLCKTCHYPLANLPEHRCPECGRPFDPASADSYATKTWLIRDRDRRNATIAVIVIIFLISACLASALLSVIIGR